MGPGEDRTGEGTGPTGTSFVPHGLTEDYPVDIRVNERPFKETYSSKIHTKHTGQVQRLKV